MTNDLTERIHRELVGSLDDLTDVLSVHVKKGWGDIFYVTIRVAAAHLSDRHGQGGVLRSAVTRVLGEERHLVTIEWT